MGVEQPDVSSPALASRYAEAFAAHLGEGGESGLGAAYALGSRHLARDPLIAAVLSLLTYGVFDRLLGVPLPGGPLMGVL